MLNKNKQYGEPIAKHLRCAKNVLNGSTQLFFFFLASVTFNV